MQGSSILFETPRLFIRQIGHHDAHAMHSIYGDQDAMRWVGNGSTLSLAECHEWIEVTLRNYGLRGYGMSGIALKNTGHIIGFCGLVHPNSQADAEIKYALHRNFWGKKYATEAAKGLLDYAAFQLGISKVIATVAPENIASHRVLEKAGMRQAELFTNDDGSHTQMFIWRCASRN